MHDAHAVPCVPQPHSLRRQDYSAYRCERPTYNLVEDDEGLTKHIAMGHATRLLPAAGVSDAPVHFGRARYEWVHQ